MKREVYRKLIHVASVAIPLLSWLLPREAGLLLLGAIAATAVGVEIARSRSPWVRYHFLRHTRLLLRAHERSGMAGATHMAIAYLVALAVFPKPIAIAAMLYNGLGDASAALVGKRWGAHRTAWGKSWEGAGAALLVNLIVGLLIPGITLAGAISGAVLSATLEFLPLPLDDNVRVTLGGGAAAWTGQALARGLAGG